MTEHSFRLKKIIQQSMPFKISYAALEERTDQQHNLKELIQELIFALQDNIKTAVSKTGLLKSSISLLLD